MLDGALLLTGAERVVLSFCVGMTKHVERRRQRGDVEELPKRTLEEVSGGRPRYGTGNTPFTPLGLCEDHDRNYRSSKIERSFSKMWAVSALLFVEDVVSDVLELDAGGQE